LRRSADPQCLQQRIEQFDPKDVIFC
jgi:hypothetical protein